MSVRRLFPIAMVFVLAVVSAVFAVPAHADDADYAIEIHKFESPHGLSFAANGLPQDTNGLNPVAGATFKATVVPGFDPLTNEGQRAIAQLSVDQALELTKGKSPQVIAKTNSFGDGSLAPLSAGLYLVQETDIQPGFVGSAPFLVALPLTNPATQNSSLSTVHVYPKDALAGITLDVRDDHAVKRGDTIFWTSHSSIPMLADIDGYQIVHTIAPQLRPNGKVTVGFDCSDCPALEQDVDYTVVFDDHSNSYTINFLDKGLRKLDGVVEKHPTAQVEVELSTEVLRAGIHENSVELYPSMEAIENRRGVSDTAETKGGPLTIVVHEVDNPKERIADTGVRLFLSEQDARAGTNPVEIDGVSEWFTGPDGRVLIDGLRFSGFANGLDIPESSDKFRRYWVVPTQIPDAWFLVNNRPQFGQVYSTDEPEEVVCLVQRAPAKTEEGLIDKIIVGIIPFIPFIPFLGFAGGSSEGSSSGSSGPSDSSGSSQDSQSSEEIAAQQPRTSGKQSLAETGVQITGIVLLGLVLIGVGFVLVTRRKAQDNQ